MPSGGVSLENIKQWKDAGACAVGVGSALSNAYLKAGYDKVVETAKEIVNALK